MVTCERQHPLLHERFEDLLYGADQNATEEEMITAAKNCRKRIEFIKLNRSILANAGLRCHG